MIIGLVGKIKTGKDTVTKIFQDKIAKTSNTKYEHKKYADKLKDIVCLLIGCTRSQLEDHSFKNKDLGDEWSKREWKIIDYENNLVSISYSKTDFDRDYLHYQEFHNIQLKTNQWDEGVEIRLTPRKLLQILGTECGRQLIHPNIWCSSLFSDYKPYLKDYPSITHSNGKPLITGKSYMNKTLNSNIAELPNWIISDVRFPNEIKAIKDRGGIIIKIERDLDKRFPNEYKKYKLELKDVSFKTWLRSKKEFKHLFHESELALDTYENWDYIINNNSGIQELITTIKIIISKEAL